MLLIPYPKAYQMFGFICHFIKLSRRILSDFYGKYNKGNPFVIKLSLYGKDNIVMKES